MRQGAIKMALAISNTHWRTLAGAMNMGKRKLPTMARLTPGLNPRADSLTQLVVSSASPLEPGEKIQLVEILPKDTLPVAGVYRFCVERAGTVDFVVMNNGDVVADNEAYIKTSREYERQTATPVEP